MGEVYGLFKKLQREIIVVQFYQLHSAHGGGNARHDGARHDGVIRVRVRVGNRGRVLYALGFFQSTGGHDTDDAWRIADIGLSAHDFDYLLGRYEQGRENSTPASVE